jgi:ribonuclease HI
VQLIDRLDLQTATETATNTTTNTTKEDQAAIEALQAEAGGENSTETLEASKMVIAKTENTFQAHC